MRQQVLAYVLGETHQQARAEGIGNDQVLLQVKLWQQKLDPFAIAITHANISV